MKTLYFDCFAGASGDMILGALVSVGVDQKALLDQIALLGVQDYSIEFQKVHRAGLSATYARVKTGPERGHRHLKDITKIINDSRLNLGIKQRATEIFSQLAQAEARVHDEPIEKVHFHEVGALDAIIDVVGASIGFEFLGVERFVCSPVHVGSGFVEMDHGRFPVPPPAVAELLKSVPIYSTDIGGELVTPTGAAIISSVCTEYGPLPKLKLEQTGYGAGTREYEKFPNVLRVLIGEEQAKIANEMLVMLETNIDDMSPEIFGHVMDEALRLGALDCYFTSVQMKKNRPGVMLSILCHTQDKEKLEQFIFLETTTLGVRSYEVGRRALEREIVKVNTPFGSIDVKVARLQDQVVNAMPEYEQCRRAASEAKVALRVVEEAARQAFAQSKKKS